MGMSIAATVLTAQSEKRRHNRLVAVARSHQLLPKVDGDVVEEAPHTLSTE